MLAPNQNALGLYNWKNRLSNLSLLRSFLTVYRRSEDSHQMWFLRRREWGWLNHALGLTGKITTEINENQRIGKSDAEDKEASALDWHMNPR